MIRGSLSLCVTFLIALTACALQERAASSKDPFTEENEGMVHLNDNSQGTSIKEFSRGIFCLFPPPAKYLAYDENNVKLCLSQSFQAEDLFSSFSNSLYSRCRIAFMIPTGSSSRKAFQPLSFLSISLIIIFRFSLIFLSCFDNLVGPSISVS